MKYLIILISLGLLGIATALTTQMIILAKENQELKTDLAEINHVRYGLLNADEWRDQVSVILGKKIIEMDLSPENRAELQHSLEIIMYGLLDDLEIIIRERTSGQFSSMKRMVASMVLDVNQLRDSVPSYAGKVLDELNKPETKKGIQTYLSDKLGNLSRETYSLDSMKPFLEVLVKYKAANKEACQEYLAGEVVERNAAINQKVLMILALVLLIFLLNIITPLFKGLAPCTDARSRLPLSFNWRYIHPHDRPGGHDRFATFPAHRRGGRYSLTISFSFRAKASPTWWKF